MTSSPLSAQVHTPGTTPSTAQSDSVELAILPALSYNTDLGLTGGGIMSRYHYKNNDQPFHSYLLISAIVSTKGLISSSLFFDKPKVFNTNQRLSTDVYVSRFFQNQYYGIGNYETLEYEAPENENFYLYKSFSAGLEVIIRKPILKHRGRSQLDIYGMGNIAYLTPWGDNSGQLITRDKPRGINGSRTAALGAGLIWENRNNEFDPTHGTYAKTGAEVSRKFLGSTSNYLIIKSEARGYFSFYLIRDITFANRLSFNHTSGSLPYWKLAELGGEQTMRGYPENRFRDNNALFLNTELRTWLWEFPDFDVRLGGTLFMDIGRTFPNSAALDTVFNDLKYTFGFGVNSSLFSENFIFRGDMGFSDEGYGIYFTAGYMF